MSHINKIVNKSLEGKSISIIGMGSFGGLLYDLLTQKFEINPQQIITFDPKNINSNSLDECYSANYIFVCTPLKIFSNTLVDLANSDSYQKNKGIIIDTCSIKQQPKNTIQQRIAQNPDQTINLIHGHGMRGPNSIDITKDIASQELKTVLTSYHGLDKASAQSFVKLLMGLGFDVVTMTENEHDLQAAISQFRTYLIARITRNAGFDKLFFDENSDQMGFNKELFDTCKIFDHQDSLFEPYATYNPHCKAVIEHISQGIQKIDDRLSEENNNSQYFGTLSLPRDRSEIKIKGDIVAAFFKTLLMDNRLLTSTAIDTKNAQRINQHLKRALSLEELPYTKDIIEQYIRPLIVSGHEISSQLVKLVGN